MAPDASRSRVGCRGAGAGGGAHRGCGVRAYQTCGGVLVSGAIQGWRVIVHFGHRIARFCPARSSQAADSMGMAAAIRFQAARACPRICDERASGTNTVAICMRAERVYVGHYLSRSKL